jgi:hypothetical protein
MLPQPALPVQNWTVTAMSFNTPAITGVVAQSGALLPITAGSTILILGSNLRGSGMSVLINGYSTPLTPTIISDTQMSVALPADVPAGVRSLQIAQSVMLGSPAVAHTGNLSNAQGFVVHPVISTPVTGSATQMTVPLQSAALAGQTAVLLLNEATAPPPPTPAAYSFSLGPLPANTSTITFPITGVKSGITYFVRVQIDGAESALNLDRTSLTFGPTVAM